MPDYLYLKESKAVQDAQREIVNTLPDVFSDEHYTDYLRFFSTFHNYTPGNAILIHNTRANASAVAGFNAWRNLGRTVIRGQHGVPLLVPVKLKSFERPKVGPDGQYILNPDGTRQMEPVNQEGVGYRKVYVFDISQTTELNLTPERKAALPPVVEKPDWIKHSDAVLRTVEAACPFAIEYDQGDTSTVFLDSDGYYDRNSETIHINQDIDETRKVKAIINNWTYQEYRVQKEAERDAQNAGKPFKSVWEVYDPKDENFSVTSAAFMTAAALGLDAKKLFPINGIKEWSESQGITDQMDFLAKIRNISHKMISDMEEKYPDILKDVELEKERADEEPVKEPETSSEPENKPESADGSVPETEKEPVLETPSEPGAVPEPESEEPSEPESSGKDKTAAGTEKKRKIDDFGEKIGGARKDLWKKRGLTLEDLVGWNDEERENLIKKASIWPTPNYKELADNGRDKVMLYAIKMLRDCLPSKPVYLLGYSKEQCQEFYINLVSDVKNMAMSLNSSSDLWKVNSFLQDHEYVEQVSSHRWKSLPKSDNCITNKVLNTFLDISYAKAEREMNKRQFLFSDEEKLMADKRIMKVEGAGILRLEPEKDCVIYNDLTQMVYCYGTEKNPVSDIKVGTYIAFDVKTHRIDGINYSSEKEARDDTLQKARAKVETEKAKKDEERKQRRKGKLKPPMLKDVERVGGEDYRNDKNVTGEDYLNDFGFRGGEFGNWLNDNERQHSLNFGYDSFKDLAKALDISDKDVALDGNLAIAFGARGHGGALAHYEPVRQVINLTKMKGAGSLGHEWIHAMDDYVGKSLGYHGMLSETPEYMKDYPESFKKLMKAIKSNPNTPEYWKKRLKDDCDRNYNTLSRRIDAVSKKWDDSEIEQKRNELKQAVLDETRKITDPNFPDLIGENASPALQSYVDFQGKHGDPHPEYNIGYLNRVRKNIAYQQDALEVHPENIPKNPGTTKFLQDAEAIDRNYAKTGHGYWSSNCELLARAGACYIKDKLTDLGIRDDYLSGHAEQSPVTDDGRIRYTYPTGDDRRNINKAFDEFFTDMRERGLFHTNEKSLDQVLEGKEKTALEHNSGVIAAEKKVGKEER